MTITAEMVKQLRERTGLGMMSCRSALVEADGDTEKAIELLRKKGELKAAKKAERGASEGGIAVCVSDDASTAAMVEIACETDFAARNPSFRTLAQEIAGTAAGWDFEGVTADFAAFKEAKQVTAKLTDAVARIGENMLLRRAARLTAANGLVGFYVHSNFKIGVLLELECAANARGKEAVRALAKDLCMQAASLNAICLSREEVPPEIVEKEREIYREQVKDKPREIQDKIIDGKLGAFCKESVLLEQQFIKEQKISVVKHIQEVSKSVGAPLAAKRFIRFIIGQD